MIVRCLLTFGYFRTENSSIRKKIITHVCQICWAGGENLANLGYDSHAKTLRRKEEVGGFAS